MTDNSQRCRPKLRFDLHKLRRSSSFGNSCMGVFQSKGPLLAVDVQNLLLYAIVGPQYSSKPRWARLKPWRSISQVILVVVNSCNKELFIRNNSCFHNIQRIFGPPIDLLPCKFMQQFVDVVLQPTDLLSEGSDNSSSILTTNDIVSLDTDCKTRFQSSVLSFSNVSAPPNGTILQPPVSDSYDGPVTKTDLLLSFLQMMNDQYPMPYDESNQFMFSQEFYAPVDAESSPVYSLDCEMCMTEANVHELTRISIVDEDLNVIYDSLVKPDNAIIDYLTKYSGITKSMLENVHTRLEQVQCALSRILSPNSILVGHSLNFDLKALKTFHPYVIDISVMYNLSGDRKLKSSLQTLAYTFLGENIQSSSKGHCSIEDAVVAMKLLKLKLEKGFQFGNVMNGWKYYNYFATAGKLAVDSVPGNDINTNQALMCKRHCQSPVFIIDPEPSKKPRLELNSCEAVADKLLTCRSCQNEIIVNCRITKCLCRQLYHSSCTFCVNSLSSTLSTVCPGPCIDRVKMQEVFQVQVGRKENLFRFLARHKKMCAWISRQCKSESAILNSKADEEDICTLAQSCSSKYILHNHVSNTVSNLELAAKFNERLLEFNLAILSLYVKDDKNALSDDLRDVDVAVRDVFKAMARNSIMCVVLNDSTKINGCCFVKIKHE